jgi:mRNA-degrading endonuclease toxin of MazEF toxin-antitoxin module
MRAGDVFRVDFGVPLGGEPGFARPAVVVTAQLVLAARPRTLHVVPLTGNTTRSLPTEVTVSAAGLDRPSAAQCHLCTVVSAQRIDTDAPLGNIGAAALAEVRAILGELLDVR